LKTATDVQPFLAALRGERPSRRPVWLMRQAGRYLPEYQKVRASHTFVQICKTPELACEVTLQPVRRFGFDAAILFSDILIPLEPMGAAFVFEDGGPRLATPVRGERDIETLRLVEPREELAFVAEAIGLLKRELGEIPLIGFAGAPFTLASYLVEGGSSKEHRHLKALLQNRPELLRQLLDRLADQVTSCLRMQIEAGCDAVQLFDSWAGILTPADHERLVLPGLQRIFSGLGDLSAPRILFSRGGVTHLSQIQRAGADAVSLDWTVGIGEALPQLAGLCLQGNLDPLVLLGPAAEIRRRALDICRAGDQATGHVFNLGHGILPETPLWAVETLVETVHGHFPGDRADRQPAARGTEQTGSKVD
jgi:uroporphyrinogen decarboxylase